TYYKENGLPFEVRRDTTGAGSTFQITTYEYNKYHALTKRTWNRSGTGGPLKTVYNYDAATGDLTSIVYDDDDTTDAYAPPSVTSIQYTRLGMISSLVDSADPTTARGYSYRSTDLQLDYETLPPATYGSSLQLNQTYDSIGRPTGWTLKRGAVTDSSV